MSEEKKTIEVDIDYIQNIFNRLCSLEEQVYEHSEYHRKDHEQLRTVSAEVAGVAGAFEVFKKQVSPTPMELKHMVETQNARVDAIERNVTAAKINEMDGPRRFSAIETTVKRIIVTMDERDAHFEKRFEAICDSQDYLNEDIRALENRCKKKKKKRK